MSGANRGIRQRSKVRVSKMLFLGRPVDLLVMIVLAFLIVVAHFYGMFNSKSRFIYHFLSFIFMFFVFVSFCWVAIFKYPVNC